VLQLLSAAGSDAADGAATLRTHADFGRTLLHLYCLRDSVDVDVLAWLCDVHPAAITHPDVGGCVPLMMLAGNSASLPAAQLLVARAPACAAHLAKDGSSALLSLAPFSAAKVPLFDFLLDLHPAHASLRPRGNRNNVLHMLLRMLTLRDSQEPVSLAPFRRVLQLSPELALQEDEWGELPLHRAVALPPCKWHQQRQDNLELLRPHAPEHG
jgi:hypothetical protein